jgi:hypothetical protein
MERREKESEEIDVGTREREIGEGRGGVKVRGK